MPSPADDNLPPLSPTPPGLYRHYKGGWYAVKDTVRCSETLEGVTLFRALYGTFGLWVRPSKRFAESGEFQGKVQPRFVSHDPRSLTPSDLPTARALVVYLQEVGQNHHAHPDLETALRPPPPEPVECCGRGCNGCVWEGYDEAHHYWKNDALDLMLQTKI